MQIDVSQPNAHVLSDGIVRALVAALAPEAARGPVAVSHSDVHSNDLAVARLADGRALVIKRGRYPWSAQRFETSRRASALLRGAGIVAPEPLRVPEELSGHPLEAYWRIDLPVLDELWPSLDEQGRESALRSFGELTRRLHGIELPAFGPLDGTRSAPLEVLVEDDLAGRLLPAAHGEWPEGAVVAERLLRALPHLDSRAAGRGAVLVHNDLHMGNVLCEVEDGRVRCVGLLDLEAAAGGIPESDFAMMQVLHGRLFGRPLDGAWFQEVRRGYGRAPDARALRFFRVLHRLNLGFYSALVGHDWHAQQVAREAAREVTTLRGEAPVPVPLAG